MEKKPDTSTSTKRGEIVQKWPAFAVARGRITKDGELILDYMPRLDPNCKAAKEFRQIMAKSIARRIVAEHNRKRKEAINQ